MNDISAQKEQLIVALNRAAPRQGNDGAAAGADFTPEPIDEGYHQMARLFNSKRGGFGTAANFPHPEMLEFCRRRFAETDDLKTQSAAFDLVCFTVQRMRKDGIFDQLGGGFARYSVDSDWIIPHFEKMLYDNGPLLKLLADAWLVSEDDGQKALFKRAAEQTEVWVMREMQSSEAEDSGGYFSTLDAGSQGYEGKHYVWTPRAVAQLLKPAWRTPDACLVAPTVWLLRGAR